MKLKTSKTFNYPRSELLRTQYEEE